MASLAQLKADCANWLNRQDIDPVFPGWVAMVEANLAQTLRSRPQETSAYQMLDRDYIPLPANFATMASIRDAATGELLELKDEWSGHWTAQYQPDGWYTAGVPMVAQTGNSFAYRLVANCIEFLPHPSIYIPDPPDPAYVFQEVLMAWYVKPVPLIAPADTNPILENLYSCYLFGVLKYGAVWAEDDERAAQVDALWMGEIAKANLHKQQQDLSGAPLREERAVVF